MQKILTTVGIADLKVIEKSGVLRTILGSCVGICLYDPQTKVAGMSHIMLPTTALEIVNPHKYADTAIPLLLEELEKLGADRSRIVAKIAGGATMFKVSANNNMGAIGRNNIEKVRSVLNDHNVDIVAEDVGGESGRTIDFDASNGDLKIKVMGKGIRVI